MILEKGYGQDYLFDFHEGKIKNGLGIGIDLDKHLLFKKGQMVMFLGMDNVGKTSWILWYYLCLSLKYDLKFCIWSGENRPGQQKRDLIQMLTGMKFKSIFKGDIIKLLNRIDNNFMFINNALQYNHKDLLKIFKNSKADACLIDPFTGINHDRRINKWERNYQFCNDIREHCNKTGQTIYINTHPQTEAARRVYPLDNELAGHIQAPKKDQETGGSCTFYDKPLLFDYNKGLGFISNKDALEGLRIACKNDLDELMKGQKVPDNFYDTEKKEEWK